MHRFAYRNVFEFMVKICLIHVDIERRSILMVRTLIIVPYRHMVDDVISVYTKVSFTYLVITVYAFQTINNVTDSCIHSVITIGSTMCLIQKLWVESEHLKDMNPILRARRLQEQRCLQILCPTGSCPRWVFYFPLASERCMVFCAFAQVVNT